MKTVILTPKAELDLEEVIDSLAESPQALARFAVNWNEQQKRLSTFPELGRSRDELAAGLRSILIKPYVVFYIVTTNGVEIVRILHGHRDVAPAFE